MNSKPTDPQPTPTPTPTPSSLKRPEELLEKHDHDGSGHLDDDELIDMESDQSFPASDAPGWTLGPTRAR